LDIKNLQKSWSELAESYSEDKNLINFYWDKISTNYSEKKRYYHNLIHINSMLEMASENKNSIYKYDEMKFAIWFHDIIYKATSKKNEEKSADFAKLALENFSKKELNINKISQLIISTKNHKIILDKDNDNAFLLDFDLSILGANWNKYEYYIQNIRKEYKIYPDFVYNPARKKVLESFVNREQLYFSEKYQELFEEQARRNLAREIKLLTQK